MMFGILYSIIVILEVGDFKITIKHFSYNYAISIVFN
jgi:hypothetical protein